MATYQTPGVYVEEISTLPPSVAGVSTAIPAFIGYTQTSEKNGADLTGTPTRISTLMEYERLFGGPADTTFTVEVDDADNILGVTASSPAFLMYYAVSMFFKNGGGGCYVVSVGSYAKKPAKKELAAGLDALKKEDEPTLILMPEAVLLGSADYHELCVNMLSQCAALKDRFAIFDVQDGEKGVDEFRDKIGTAYLSYGAAYYPFLMTTLSHYYTDPSVAVTKDGSKSKKEQSDQTLDQLKEAQTALYNKIKLELSKQRVVMPPASAVAGVYARVDREQGVWKAPANESLMGVIGPTVKITHDEQARLNVHPQTGKSINAIRAFSGQGILIWGARTLAGNDNEWRYISVRRLFNMVEESIQKATGFAVFENNDAMTWLKIKSMIESFLDGLWRQGAFAGASPEEAYFVNVGLGTTMTQDDILNGIMNIEIGLAAVRPAEFIVLKFSHKL